MIRHGSVLLDSFVARLARIRPLAACEVQLIHDSVTKVRSYDQGMSIKPEFLPHPVPTCLVSGWAFRSKTLRNGAHQLLSVFMPGDILGVRRAERPLDAHEIICITPTRTASLAGLYSVIDKQRTDFSGLDSSLYALERAEEIRLISHLARIGGQNALERTSSFMLELYRRAARIDFVTEGSFSMPLTQGMLGDALGLSIVHIARVFRTLREAGVARIKAGTIYIDDLQSLIELSPELDSSTYYL